MNTVTQTMQFRQSLLKYAEKYGVTKAAIKYNVNRQYIYRWKRRYNGDIQSLANKSHRPHHHPNQHASHKFYSFEDFKNQLAVRCCNYNRFPLRPLGWLSPIEYLAKYTTDTSLAGSVTHH